MLPGMERVCFPSRDARCPSILALEQLLGDQIRTFGPADPETLATRHQLAAACGKLGHSSRALGAYEALTEDLVRVSGTCHPDTLRARRMFALWLGRCDQVTEAITELEQLLIDQIRTRADGTRRCVPFGSVQSGVWLHVCRH